MNVSIEQAYLNGKMNAIPSKSYAHRILICNFLAGAKLNVDLGEFSSKDICATKNCLNQLRNGGKVLDCGESGSTLRFMLPLCAALGGEYQFIGHGKLIERPNEQLFLAMAENGVTLNKADRIYLSGKLKAGEYRLRGDISSQYVSGLLMALPTLNGDSKIILTTPLVSAPYVDVTLEVLKNFGVIIEKKEYGYFIKGNQKYLGQVKPEGDWSNMAFFLAGGAINGDITICGLNLNSVQGDRYITEILERAGADISYESGYVRVKKSQLKAFTFDGESCPDLVPISAVLAAYANGTSVIKNIKRLKIKESDRIDTTIKMLAAFNVMAKSDGVDLTIYGGVPVKSGKVDSFNDHRIVMSAAILALKADGKSIITDCAAVEKSYPTFFDDYTSVGGKVNVL